MACHKVCFAKVPIDLGANIIFSEPVQANLRYLYFPLGVYSSSTNFHWIEMNSDLPSLCTGELALGQDTFHQNLVHRN